MKKRIPFFSFLFILALLFTNCQDDIYDMGKPAPSNGGGLENAESDPINYGMCGSVAETNLIAGQNEIAGKVIVSQTGDLLTVTYKMNGWALVETHLSVAENQGQIPQSKSGNPKIGKFELQKTHSPYAMTYTYADIDVSEFDIVTIAAHAVVKKIDYWETDTEQIGEFLPDENVIAGVFFTGDPSYFQTVVLTGGDLEGAYEGFCVDIGRGIYSGYYYSMVPVSTYDQSTGIFDGLVDRPENLDLVNYVINQDFSTLGAGGEELQGALWSLVEPVAPVNSAGGIAWDQDIVDSILEAAYENGEGFIPDGNGEVAILLVPGSLENPVGQVTIISVPMSSIPEVSTPYFVDGDETAWADGDSFPGRSWASTFRYCTAW